MTFDSTKAPDVRADCAQRRRERELAPGQDDGRVGPTTLDPGTGFCEPIADSPPLSNAELVQLRVRVIALENLIIALLAEADLQQLEGIRRMAAYISPRESFTLHPMTIHAAKEMNSLVDRADQFRAGQASATS